MMRDESILKRILSLRSVFVINIVILCGIVIGLGRTYWNNYHLRKEIGALETQAKSLEAKNIEITKLKRYFESPDFLEEEARLKLGLQKEGEETVIVGGASGGVQEVREVEEKESGDTREDWLGNPKSWWKYFFH